MIHPEAHAGGPDALPEQEPAPLKPDHQTVLIGLPADAQIRVRNIPAPQYTMNGNVLIPTATPLTATVDLLQVAGIGIIRSARVSVYNAVAVTAGLLTVDLRSTYNEIYHQAVLQLPAAGTALNGLVIEFQDEYVPFKNGLRLSVSVQAAFTSGNVAAQVVWEA